MEGIDLSQYRLGSLPSIYVIPNFISQHIEDHLLSTIDATKNWNIVSGRKVQVLGGTISKQNKLISTPIPSWIDPILNRITSISPDLYGNPNAVNHVLINTYQPGEGIMPHQDGPLYYPSVCILSLGSSTIMKFYSKRDNGGDSVGGDTISNNTVVASVILPPRSLLIFRDDAYTDCLHGIDFVEDDIIDVETLINPSMIDSDSITNTSDSSSTTTVVHRSGRRVSLTVRRVLQVHKFGLLSHKR